MPAHRAGAAAHTVAPTVGRLLRHRVLSTLLLLTPVGAGCAATPGQDALQQEPELDRPPVVLLLAGTRPEGVLVYEDWVTEGQQRTEEADAVPADLVAVPWRRGDRLRFEIGSGQLPSWANVLVHGELPADRVPDADPERIECLPAAVASQCTVDQPFEDSTIRITAHPSGPGEIVVLNVGWELPERYQDHDPPLPPYVSASWVFATAQDPVS